MMSPTVPIGFVKFLESFRKKSFKKLVIFSALLLVTVYIKDAADAKDRLLNEEIPKRPKGVSWKLMESYVCAQSTTTA